jgi:hypothetical protein
VQFELLRQRERPRSHGLRAAAGRSTIASSKPKRVHGPYEHAAICPSRTEWVVGIGLQPRRVRYSFSPPYKGLRYLKATGNLRAVQILLGLAKNESTVRYLGVDVEDALELSKKTESDRRARPDAGPPDALNHLQEANLFISAL